MALIGEMQYLTIGGKTYSLPAGGGGTVTSVAVSNATNGGLSISGSPINSSGTITIGHSNVLAAAQTTQAVYPIKIDKNGHISEYGNAVTIPTVNDATLTIQKNGVNVETFSANAASNKTANIVVNEVPSGGTGGQVLTKHSATNYDVEWADASAGAFIITFTYDDANDSWSCDKTAQEIYEAYQSGSAVIGYEIAGDYGYPYYLFECALVNGEPYARFVWTYCSGEFNSIDSRVFYVGSSEVTQESSYLEIITPFIVHYGDNVYAEVGDAYDNGVTIICIMDDGDNAKIFQLNRFDDVNDTFFFVHEESHGYRWVSIASDDTWNQGVIDFALFTEVPQRTSALTNDSGFLTLATLPIYNGGVS